MRSPLGAAIAAVLAASSPGLQAQAATQEGVRLTELRSIHVPTDVSLRGAIVSVDGRIAAWSNREVYFERNGTLAVVSLDVLAPVAVAWEDASWEVLDASGPAIVHVDAAGIQAGTTVISLSARPIEAFRLRCGWLVVTESANPNTIVLALLDSFGRPQWLRRIQHFEQSALSGHGVTITGTDSIGIVTMIQSPYSIATVDCSGNVHEHGLDIPLPAFGTWVAARTIAAGDGYFTTFADVTSDARIIRRRGFDFRHLSDRSVNVPFALLHYNGHGLLVAARQTDIAELVLYSIDRE